MGARVPWTRIFEISKIFYGALVFVHREAEVNKKYSKYFSSSSIRGCGNCGKLEEPLHGKAFRSM